MKNILFLSIIFVACNNVTKIEQTIDAPKQDTINWIRDAYNDDGTKTIIFRTTINYIEVWKDSLLTHPPIGGHYSSQFIYDSAQTTLIAIKYKDYKTDREWVECFTPLKIYSFGN